MIPDVKIMPKVLKRLPTYKTLAQIRTLETSKKEQGKSLGGVYGLVDPHFEFIHDPHKDWKPTHSVPRMWRFEGTMVTLQVSPEVFLPEDYRKYPAVLKPIVAHEDLHVQDARAIVQTTLPEQLKKDKLFKDAYIQRTPVSDATFSYMVCQKMTGYVCDMFAIIWNEKVNERDQPAKYRLVQQAVDAALRSGYR
jgi:hypothetical protein